MADSNKRFVCDRKYTQKRTFYAHTRKKHDVEPNTDGSVKCPKDGCNYSFHVLASLRLHVQEKHKVGMVKKKIVFRSFNDFLKWKSKEEKKTNSTFVQQGGARHLKGGTKLVYVCHRTGVFTSRSEGKRLLKSQGSNKMGSPCTAAIEVSLYESGTCAAIYFKTHFGHEMHIGFLNLSRSDREAIAEQILDGVPFETILEDVRDSIHTGVVKERLQLLTRQDLHNIVREFGIGDIHPFVCHRCHREGELRGTWGKLSTAAKQEENLSTKEACAILSPIQKQNDEQETAARAKQLETKLQLLMNRVNSSALSVQTVSILDEDVERWLSLTNSDFNREVLHSASSRKVKVPPIPDMCNILPSGIFRKPTLPEKTNVAEGAPRQLDIEVLTVDVSSEHSYCKN